ncbi:DUF3228 family protein [bacterium]|nr:DUF3228 family protein [bacterium]
MRNDPDPAPSLGWSDFAAGRHRPGGKHTWFGGTPDELLDRVRANWSQRRPGAGRTGLDKVVVVPVDPAGFVSSTVRVDESTTLHAAFERRQAHEDGYVRVTAAGPREPAVHASVVLYSADTLLENGGTRSTDCAWEVVCLIAGPSADEPMDPLTMARNMLAKPGGTFCAYSAEQFAEAVWYWAARASAHVPPREAD